MTRRGTMRCTVDVLHNDDNILFDFLEKNFKIIDIDHSELHSDIVKLTLEDISDSFFFIESESVHEYSFKLKKIYSDFTMAVELVD